MSKNNVFEKGFTLIELIVVIIILGVLAAVAIPSYQGLIKPAKTAALQGMAGGLLSQGGIMQAAAIANGCTAASSYVGGACATGSGGYWPTFAQIVGANGLNYIVATTSTPAGFYANTAGSAINYYPASSTTADTACQAVYTPGTASTIPSVAYTLTNC